MRPQNKTPLTPEQNELAEQNRWLVFVVVKRLVRSDRIVSKFGIQEAIGEGLLAIVKAARGYRAETGYQFSTYAYRAIQTEVLRAAYRWARHTVDSLPWDESEMVVMNGHPAKMRENYLVDKRKKDIEQCSA